MKSNPSEGGSTEPHIRTFEREVHLIATAQYEQRGDALFLKRWRVVADGKPVGEWCDAVPDGSNGGWANCMNACDVTSVGSGVQKSIISTDQMFSPSQGSLMIKRRPNCAKK
jgi:hypothetical protein